MVDVSPAFGEWAEAAWSLQCKWQNGGGPIEKPLIVNQDHVMLSKSERKVIVVPPKSRPVLDPHDVTILKVNCTLCRCNQKVATAQCPISRHP